MFVSETDQSSTSRTPMVSNSRFEPSVAVIVPCYNVESYVAATIESVLAQDRGADEIILVDDGSTDGTKEILRMYADADGRVSIVSQDNQGLSAARNAGVDKSNSDFIVFVDADDIIASDYLTNLTRALSANDAVTMALFAESTKFGDSEIGTVKALAAKGSGPVSITVLDPRLVVRRIMLTETPPTACNCVFRRDHLLQERFVRDLRFEDLELMSRIVALQDRVAIINAANGYFYRQHGGSIMHSNLGAKVDSALEVSRRVEENVALGFPGDEIYSAAVRLKLLRYVLGQFPIGRFPSSEYWAEFCRAARRVRDLPTVPLNVRVAASAARFGKLPTTIFMQLVRAIVISPIVPRKIVW